MPIENRELRDGMKLAAKYKGETWTAEVGQTEDGLRIKLEDGRGFKSPSAAGSAVMGGSACNGWRFWSIAGEESEKPKKAKKGAGKKPEQNGLVQRLDDGRFFCSACQEAFEAPEEGELTACPRGHTAETAETQLD